jgi:glycosyltransferase involved in cell wall biosynthesis
MKVLFANNYYYLRGGSERVLFDEMEMLRARGHEALAFSRRNGRNVPCPQEEFFPPDFSYDGVPLSKKAAAAFRLVYSPQCRSSLAALLGRFRPDLMHAHNIYGRLTTAVLDAAEGAGVPVVMTLHDYKLLCPSYLMLRGSGVCEACLGGGFYHCAVRRCHRGSLLASAVVSFESYFNRALGKFRPVRYFICPSRFMLEKHALAGFPREKLLHVPNSIDTGRLRPDYGPGGYVLYAGRLSREKGVITLLRAVKGLGLTLRVAGAGPMRQECEAFAARHGIENVVFEGHREGDDLGALFRGAAFVVFPSEWYENAPMTVLEAFAYGKPVVASKAGGIPEMVEDGMTGLLFSPGDHEELREKIMFLADRPSLVSSMGREARRKVEDNHGSALHYERLMEAYGRACGLRAAETGAAI